MTLGQLLRVAATVNPILKNELIQIFKNRFPKAFESSKEALEWKINNEPEYWSDIGDPISKQLQIAIDIMYMDERNYSEKDFLHEFKSLIERARKTQLYFTFSLEDFKILSTEVIFKYVTENYLSNYIFTNQIDINQFNNLFRNAFATFGLTLFYEFKIPVALKETEYDILNVSQKSL